MKLLTPAEVARIGQLAGCIESTRFPGAYYCEEERRGLFGIAAELRRIAGLPPVPDMNKQPKGENP